MRPRAWGIWVGVFGACVPLGFGVYLNTRVGQQTQSLPPVKESSSYYARNYAFSPRKCHSFDTFSDPTATAYFKWIDIHNIQKHLIQVGCTLKWCFQTAPIYFSNHSCNPAKCHREGCNERVLWLKFCCAKQSDVCMYRYTLHLIITVSPLKMFSFCKNSKHIIW